MSYNEKVILIISGNVYLVKIRQRCLIREEKIPLLIHIEKRRGGEGTRMRHAVLFRDVINAPLHFLGTKVGK